MGFEDEGEVRVGGVDVAGGALSVAGVWVEIEGADFANSIRDAVTAGTQSFLTRSMFLGGAGHWRESKLLLRVSVIVSGGDTCW